MIGRTTFENSIRNSIMDGIKEQIDLARREVMDEAVASFRKRIDYILASYAVDVTGMVNVKNSGSELSITIKKMEPRGEVT